MAPQTEADMSIFQTRFQDRQIYASLRPLTTFLPEPPLAFSPSTSSYRSVPWSPVSLKTSFSTPYTRSALPYAARRTICVYSGNRINDLTLPAPFSDHPRFQLSHSPSACTRPPSFTTANPLISLTVRLLHHALFVNSDLFSLRQNENWSDQFGWYSRSLCTRLWTLGPVLSLSKRKVAVYLSLLVI